MRNVLIVEDHADLREMLAVLLESEGFQVQTASNGAEALSAMHQRRPSVILLDLMMPVMDGWQLRAEMLADPALREVPVILLSGVHDLEEVGASLGAVASLRKPVTLSALRPLIAVHLPSRP